MQSRAAEWRNPWEFHGSPISISLQRRDTHETLQAIRFVFCSHETALHNQTNRISSLFRLDKIRFRPQEAGLKIGRGTPAISGGAAKSRGTGKSPPETAQSSRGDRAKLTPRAGHKNKSSSTSAQQKPGRNPGEKSRNPPGTGRTAGGSNQRSADQNRRRRGFRWIYGRGFQ
jgi:hypothetical protein